MHAEEGDLRLVDRMDVNGWATGAVQAYINGEWGAVCSTSWDDNEANVACKQLGFAGPGYPLYGTLPHNDKESPRKATEVQRCPSGRPCSYGCPYVCFVCRLYRSVSESLCVHTCDL
jgi:hypothetical protein